MDVLYHRMSRLILYMVIKALCLCFVLCLLSVAPDVGEMCEGIRHPSVYIAHCRVLSVRAEHIATLYFIEGYIFKYTSEFRGSKQFTAT